MCGLSAKVEKINLVQYTRMDSDKLLLWKAIAKPSYSYQDTIINRVNLEL